jgi:hypothetical protein
VNNTQRFCVALWLVVAVVPAVAGCASHHYDATPHGVAANFRDLVHGNVALHNCQDVTVPMFWMDGTTSAITVHVCRHP